MRGGGAAGIVSPDVPSGGFTRAFVRGLAPCIVLGLGLFAILRIALLPARGAHPDLAHARALVAAQWLAPVIALHLVAVMVGVVVPFARGAAPARAAWQATAALPVAWLHALAGQLMVVLGTIAGVVPGVLATAPAIVIAGAVADGARGGDAFAAASAAARRSRGLLVALVLGAVAVEVGAAVVTWKLIVPVFGKKPPQAVLDTTVRFAWINAIRTAVTAPLIATAIAALYASRAPRTGDFPIKTAI